MVISTTIRKILNKPYLSMYFWVAHFMCSLPDSVERIRCCILVIFMSGDVLRPVPAAGALA